jgi:two-component sensor histidine kinase
MIEVWQLIKKLSRMTRSPYWATLIGTFVVPWLVVVVFSFLYYPSMQRVSSRNAAQRHIETLSEMIAFAAGAGLSESNFGLLQTAFDWSRKDSNVTYLGIFDENDSLVVEFSRLRSRIKPPPLTETNGITEESDGLTSVSFVKVEDKRLGRIVLRYSLEAVNLSISHQHVVSVLVSLVVFAIGLWGTVLLARQGSALHMAKAGAEDQARLLAHQAEELTHSNIELERSNNELRQVQRELQQAHDEMEQRVKDRTAKLAAANDSIRSSLKEKEVLLREIHHRVKNNMQVISSLLNLQSSHIRDEQDRVLFCESQSRVRSMALIHEKLYQSKSLARIDFNEYVNDLSRTICRSHGLSGVTLHVDAAGIYFGVDTAIPCGLIVNELITNSLKYAFPDGRAGRVFVYASLLTPQKCTLRIGDDGIGFPSDIDIRNTKTLGLQLVHTLAQQLGATVNVQREQGTIFEFTFSLPETHQNLVRPLHNAPAAHMA